MLPLGYSYWKLIFRLEQLSQNGPWIWFADKIRLLGFVNRKNNKQNIWNIEILQKSNLRALAQILNDVYEKWSSWFSYSRYRYNDIRKVTKWTGN